MELEKLDLEDIFVYQLSDVGYYIGSEEHKALQKAIAECGGYGLKEDGTFRLYTVSFVSEKQIALFDIENRVLHNRIDALGEKFEAIKSRKRLLFWL